MNFVFSLLGWFQIDTIICEGEKKFKAFKEKEDKILDDGYKGYYKFGLIRYRHDVAEKWDLSYLSSRSYLSNNSNFFDLSKMSDLLKKSGDSIHLDTLHIGNLPNVLEEIHYSDMLNKSDIVYLTELSNSLNLSHETDLSGSKDMEILPFLSDKSYWTNSLNRTHKSYLHFRLYMFWSDTLDKSDRQYLSDLSDRLDVSYLLYKSDLSYLSYLSDLSYRSNLTNLTNLTNLSYRSYISDRSDRLDLLDRWYRLDLLDRWDRLDRLDSLDRLDLLDKWDRLDRWDRLDEWNLLDGLDRWDNELDRWDLLDRSYRLYLSYRLDLSYGSYLSYLLHRSYKSDLSYLSYLSDRYYGTDLSDSSYRLYRLNRLHYLPMHIRKLNKHNFFWSTLFSNYDNKYKSKHSDVLNDMNKRYKLVGYDSLKLADYMSPRIDSLEIKMDSLKPESSEFSYWSKEVDTIQIQLDILKNKIPDVNFYTPYWFYQLEPDFRRAENARRYLKYGFVDYLKWVLHYLAFLCILLLALYYAKLNSFFSALYLSLCVFLVILFLGGKFFGLMEWEIKDYLHFNYVGIVYGLIALVILCLQAWFKRNNTFTVFCFHTILVTIILFFMLGILCDYHLFMSWIKYTVPCWALFSIQAIGISAVLLMAHIRSLPRS